MTGMDDDWRELNRAAWDERTAIHVGPGGYDLDALRAGRARLNAIEEAELGPVAGLRVLHLQCHFGRDSLILASRGASVTGLDFSAPAIATARDLATDIGVSARFVQADLYDAPAAIGEQGTFDLVYVTWGALCWLPDIVRWGEIVAGFLRPGGALYLAEAHPHAYVYDDATAGMDGRPGLFEPYFGTGPIVYDNPDDYVHPTAQLTHSRQVNWLHRLDSILGALLAAGLHLEWLHEHPRATWRMFRCLIEDAEGCWVWPDRPWLPLSFSLRAIRR